MNNVKLYKLDKVIPKNKTLEDIVICNLENIVLFPVQILKKEDSNFLASFPKRNRGAENGQDVEYMYFNSFETYDKLISNILEEYKQNKNNLSMISSSVDLMEPINCSLDIMAKKIDHKYIKHFLTLNISDKIYINGFKLANIEQNPVIISPSFFYSKVLYNKFTLTQMAETKIINLCYNKKLIVKEE